MAMARVFGSGIVILLFLGGLGSAAELGPVCSPESAVDYISLRTFSCPANGNGEFTESVDVLEGDEILLQTALNILHNNSGDYVALLFYASWCPFSRTFRPSFSVLHSLYPSIPHIAIEESAVRPSILSKYGVHGFPTIFLINSTMRVRYQGSRTIGSLVAFYSDITGFKSAPLNQTSLDRVGHLSNQEKQNATEHESCPFSWARSPENLLGQDTYLALATAFVVMRFVYLFYPTLLACARCAWRKHIRNVSFWILLEHPMAFLNRVIQLVNSLKDPCKRSNLRGATSARAWASKSLATVSIGDASSSRSVQLSECH